LTGGGTFGGATFAGVATFTEAATFTGSAARFDDKVEFGGGVTLTTAPATFNKTAFFADGTSLLMTADASTVTLGKPSGALAVGVPVTNVTDVYSQVLAPSTSSSAPVVLTPMAGTKLIFGGSLNSKTVAQEQKESSGNHGIKITGKATLISGTTYTVASESTKIGTLELGDSAGLTLGPRLTVGTAPQGYAHAEPRVVLTGAENAAGAILKGVGSLFAGDTTIVGGTIGWHVVDTATGGVGTVTIAKDRITGGAASVALTGAAGANIKVTATKTLTLGLTTTVDLAGSTGTPGASITLGRNGTLAFTAASSKVLLGAGTSGDDITGTTNMTIGGVAVTATGSFAVADFKVVGSGPKNLVTIGGANVGDLNAGAADVVIDSAKPVGGGV
jgi:hypothetical protein